MRVGDTPVRPGTLEPAGEIISLDEQAGRIALKLGPSRTPLGDEASLIPQGPIGDKVLRDAITASPARWSRAQWLATARWRTSCSGARRDCATGLMARRSYPRERTPWPACRRR